MEQSHKDKNFEEIQKLIGLEEERSLQEFRKRDFEGNVLRRIEAESQKKSFLRRWAPVFGLNIFIIAAVALAIFLTMRSGPTSQIALTPLEQILQQMPGLKKKPTFSSSAEELSSFGQALKIAFCTTREKNIESKPSSPPERKFDPRLDLKRKMEILFQEKAIEQFLLKYAKTIEEV
jgi:hypothetical protein